MNKKALAMALAMVMALGVVLTGCGGGGNSGSSASPSAEAPATGSPAASPEATTSGEPIDSPSTSPEASGSTGAAGGLKAVMVTDVGGVNDESFNQSAWEGMNKAKDDFGYEVNFIESKQQGDYIPNLETALDGDPDIIWGIGFMMSEAMLEAAKNNPNQKYAIVDAGYSEEQGQPDNLLTVNFKAEEGSFLVGYIAAKTSKSNKIGFVGGVDNPLINAFEYGYQAGAKTANKDIEISVQYVDSFNDAALGKAAAQQMYKDGCDVVYHAAGDSGKGVIEAAKEQGEGKWAIGVDKDQNSLAPDNVLTSAMKNVGTGMHHIMEDYSKGEFAGGQNITYDLKDGGVGIAPTSDKNVDAAIMEETKGIEEKIVSGDIVVPATEEDLKKYVDSL